MLNRGRQFYTYLHSWRKKNKNRNDRRGINFFLFRAKLGEKITQIFWKFSWIFIISTFCTESIKVCLIHWWFFSEFKWQKNIFVCLHASKFSRFLLWRFDFFVSLAPSYIDDWWVTQLILTKLNSKNTLVCNSMLIIKLLILFSLLSKLEQGPCRPSFRRLHGTILPSCSKQKWIR